MNLLLACRFANVGIYALVAVFYFVRSNDRWAGYGFGDRLKRTGILGVFVVLAIGSGNAYVQHVRPTWPVALLTVSGLAVLVGLWLSRDRRP